MKRFVWPVILLLAGCATEPSPRAPVIERAPQAQKPAPTPAKAPVAVIPGMPAPTAEKDWRPENYIVKKGDTLYGIGLEFGFDYKEIAQWNNIPQPYVIHIGQALKLKVGGAPTEPAQAAVIVTPMKSELAVAPKTIGGPPFKTEPKAIKEPYSEQAMNAPLPKAGEAPAKIEIAKTELAKLEAPKTEAVKPAEPAKIEPITEKPNGEKPAAAGDDEALDWNWPAQGKLLTGFNEAAGSKGMDIAGTQGQPVLAAAAGKVVYSGAGLRGYGKLVIVKHNKTYLSAYAHNSQILVKEGQEVAKGQKIAEMGSTDSDHIKLHFEIRKLGKPIDPSKYLPEKP